ncbi:MAG: NERD domain-containing protein [Gammaproteobacteria bacterium]|nr:NERD domain-containing protein [Gammaproteobacteria bacterium]MBU1556743.1 NERD domain-containing protein [Gammaproteobacteria bacterium]MBU2070030.1 NERD domain-containing protein [Gammaproteobacteria bacterium]MBU2183674.1 NERD domain-containing protein [Gammaproteobacteria bacterium]MBU2205564.1 NERD domain-containing protein [Gammaproteobacteria bacterium]
MRWMRFTLPLLLLISPLAFGQKQYTEGACLLLQHQMVQFAAQPNSHNYQSAKREVDNHCQNPIPAPEHELNLTNAPAKANAATPVQTASNNTVVTPQPASTVTPSTPLQTKQLPPKFDMGAMMFGLFTPYLPYIIGFVLLGLLPGLVITVLFGNKAKFLGAMAERSLHKLLLKQLPMSYKHYRNLVLQTAQGDLTEVDHLIISPFGIFVLEVKNYQGWIFGNEKQPEWTVQHFRRKHRFMNPLRQNYKHTEAVKHVLGLTADDAGKVHPLVVFSPRAAFKTPMPDNVLHLDQTGDYINQYYQQCFSDEQLRQFSARLNIAATSRKALSKLHLEQVKAKKAA